MATTFRLFVERLFASMGSNVCSSLCDRTCVRVDGVERVFEPALYVEGPGGSPPPPPIPLCETGLSWGCSTTSGGVTGGVPDRAIRSGEVASSPGGASLNRATRMCYMVAGGSSLDGGTPWRTTGRLLCVVVRGSFPVGRAGGLACGPRGRLCSTAGPRGLRCHNGNISWFHHNSDFRVHVEHCSVST